MFGPSLNRSASKDDGIAGHLFNRMGFAVSVSHMKRVWHGSGAEERLQYCNRVDVKDL